MTSRRIRRYRGSRKGAELRRARIRYMRRRHRQAVRIRRFVFLFCTVLAAGYLLVLIKQGGRLIEIESIWSTEVQNAEKQPLEMPGDTGEQFGAIFRLKDGEITLYRESSY